VNVRDLAKAMNGLRARFITITAYQLPKEEGFRLEYHWDLDGQLLGFSFQLAGKSIESIYDLCEAVDWIEREIHEGFDIDFMGREYEPLLLRQGETPGVKACARRKNELQDSHGSLSPGSGRTLQAGPDLRRRNRLRLPSCVWASTSAASSIWPKRATIFR
jgi:hypothetical protein